VIGSLGHALLELAGEEDVSLKEERFFIDVDGYTVSGQVDLVDDREVLDFKFTSVEKYLTGKDKGFPEWEKQLNQYRVLAAMNGYTIRKLTIVIVFRNWSKSKSGDPDYPRPAVSIDIPLWDKAKAWGYIRERVRLHAESRTAKLEDMTPCTEEERWVRGTKWKVTKPGAQRSYRSFDTEEEAQQFYDELDEAKQETYEIVKDPGRAVRCDSWCAVSAFCPVYEEWQKKRGSDESLFLTTNWFKR
jgi:hypothetical protein